jgi:hypothetical protein
MRPAILQWKVMLGLLAVIIVGASLGSALHSDGTPHRELYTYATWDTIRSYRTPKMLREMRPLLCAPPKLQPGVPRSERPQFCRKHR